MAKLLSKEELIEVQETLKKIITYVKLHTRGTVYYDIWYAGITGQDQIDEIKIQLIKEAVSEDEIVNEVAKRINGHKAKFPKMVENSWEEWETSSMGIALEVETQLHKMGFFGEGASGRKGNLTLNPDIVYVFLHGEDT